MLPIVQENQSNNLNHVNMVSKILINVLSFIIILNWTDPVNGGKWIYEDDGYTEGDTCDFNATVTGICAKKCYYSEPDSTIQQKLCTFSHVNLLICCPPEFLSPKITPKLILPTSRISIRKCEEYKGHSQRFKRTHIVGGTETKYGEFPHMAAIGWTAPDGSIDWKCGGSLISYDYIITAAHCTRDVNIPPDIIRIGDKDLNRFESYVNIPQNFSISQIVKHPEYSGFSNYHDIALIKLNQSVTINQLVKPTCLWPLYDFDTTEAIATGYGLIEWGGKKSEALLKVDLTIYTNDYCTLHYGEVTSRLKNGIINKQLCAGDTSGMKDTCQGDSGGPLQIDMGSKNYYIIGITSFGKGCASSLPSVYTRISEYIDWIESVVWPN